MIAFSTAIILLKPILALLVVITFIYLYAVSKRTEEDYSQELAKYRFNISFMAPIGFYLLAKFPLKWYFNHDRNIIAKITELYGHRNTNTFFKIHLAQKITLVTGTVFLVSLIYLMGDVEISFLIFGLIIAALIYFWVDKDLDSKIAARKREILIDFPDFLNLLVLLVNAGLPYSVAVQKIVKQNDSPRALYKELGQLLADISSGRSNNQAYEDFARRCRAPQITRFVSTILQNLNKGSSDLVHILRSLSQEAWEKRKDIARKQGEEASSKLVFPMVMIFVAVAIIVLAPAMITMSR